MHDQNDTIILPAGGIEYIHWTLAGLPEPAPAAVEVSLDRGVTWTLATLTGTTARLLVRHPSATAPAEPHATAIVGNTEVRIRLIDNPEKVIRGGGILSVPRS